MIMIMKDMCVIIIIIRCMNNVWYTYEFVVIAWTGLSRQWWMLPEKIARIFIDEDVYHSRGGGGGGVLVIEWWKGTPTGQLNTYEIYLSKLTANSIDISHGYHFWYLTEDAPLECIGWYSCYKSHLIFWSMSCPLFRRRLTVHVTSQIMS